MSATITTTPDGCTVFNPYTKKNYTFRNLLQAVTYCRDNGLTTSFNIDTPTFLRLSAWSR